MQKIPKTVITAKYTGPERKGYELDKTYRLYVYNNAGGYIMVYKTETDDENHLHTFDTLNEFLKCWGEVTYIMTV